MEVNEEGERARRRVESNGGQKGSYVSESELSVLIGIDRGT